MCSSDLSQAVLGDAGKKVPIGMAGAALALHLPAAAPTDHLAFQNVVCRLPLRNYIVCSGLKCLLNGIECSGSDQRFMGGFYSSFLFSLYQHTCIGTIGKNVFDRSAVPTAVAIAKVSIQTVGSSVLDWSWEPSFIQISDNAGHASARSEEHTSELQSP